MNHEPHELCEIFPKMSEPEFQAFKENIKKEGVKNPVVLHAGKILDGYHRYRACSELGILPPLEVFSGTDPVEYVWSQNIERRHLMPGQIATINAKMNLYRTLHPVDLSGKESLISGMFPTKTSRDLASDSGISEKTQYKADAVLRENPELSDKVLKGDISLEKAYQEVKPRREPAERPAFEKVAYTLTEETNPSNPAAFEAEMYGDSAPEPEINWEQEWSVAQAEADRLQKLLDDITDDAGKAAREWEAKFHAIEGVNRQLNTTLQECIKDCKAAQFVNKTLRDLFGLDSNKALIDWARHLERIAFVDKK